MNSITNNRTTKLYIDLSAIEHNIVQIKKKLQKNVQIMGVIKASGYGSGAVKIVNTLIKKGINYIAVAIPEEGMQLRSHGVKAPILVLNNPLHEEFKTFLDNNLIPCIPDYEVAKGFNRLAKGLNKIVKVHVEIDTGMGRTGIQASKAIQYIKRINKLQNVEIEGVFTHFSCSDWDKKYTELQTSLFDEVINSLEQQGINIPIKHACNSAGIIGFPQAHYNMIRSGLMIYGYYPDKSLRKDIELKPSFALKSKVSFIKEVPQDTPISYNRTFVTQKISKIATIPIGYADGYRRELSNKGYVVIKGKRAPIVGLICMDMFMVDVTHIPNVKTGDEVILFDENNITVEEIAQLCGTINYEILSTISNRVPREYINSTLL